MSLSISNRSDLPLIRNDPAPLFLSGICPVPRSEALSRVYNCPPSYQRYESNKSRFRLLSSYDFNSLASREGLSLTERIRYMVLGWFQNPHKKFDRPPFGCSYRLANGYFDVFKKKGLEGLKDDQIIPWIRALEEGDVHFKSLKPDMSKSCKYKWAVIDLWRRDLEVRKIMYLVPNQKPAVATIISQFKKHGINYLNIDTEGRGNITKHKRLHQDGNLPVSSESRLLGAGDITIKPLSRKRRR